MNLKVDQALAAAKGAYDAELARFNGVYSGNAVPFGLLTLGFTALVTLSAEVLETWDPGSVRMWIGVLALCGSGILLSVGAVYFQTVLEAADRLAVPDLSDISVADSVDTATKTESATQLTLSQRYLDAARTNGDVADKVRKGLAAVREFAVAGLISLAIAHSFFSFTTPLVG
jgi:hypothetical protein